MARLGLRLALPPGQRATLVADASADALDAVLCLMLAAWAEARHGDGPGPGPGPGYGLPAAMDPLEGWIVGAIPGGCPVVSAGDVGETAAAPLPPHG